MRSLLSGGIPVRAKVVEWAGSHVEARHHRFWPEHSLRAFGPPPRSRPSLAPGNRLQRRVEASGFPIELDGREPRATE